MLEQWATGSKDQRLLEYLYDAHNRDDPLLKKEASFVVAAAAASTSSSSSTVKHVPWKKGDEKRLEAVKWALRHLPRHVAKEHVSGFKNGYYLDEGVDVWCLRLSPVVVRQMVVS